MPPAFGVLTLWLMRHADDRAGDITAGEVRELYAAMERARLHGQPVVSGLPEPTASLAPLDVEKVALCIAAQANPDFKKLDGPLQDLMAMAYKRVAESIVAKFGAPPTPGLPVEPSDEATVVTYRCERCNRVVTEWRDGKKHFCDRGAVPNQVREAGETVGGLGHAAGQEQKAGHEVPVQPAASAPLGGDAPRTELPTDARSRSLMLRMYLDDLAEAAALHWAAETIEESGAMMTRWKKAEARIERLFRGDVAVSEGAEHQGPKGECIVSEPNNGTTIRIDVPMGPELLPGWSAWQTPCGCRMATGPNDVTLQTWCDAGRDCRCEVCKAYPMQGGESPTDG